jgi:hypothetical protein
MFELAFWIGNLGGEGGNSNREENGHFVVGIAFVVQAL